MPAPIFSDTSTFDTATRNRFRQRLLRWFDREQRTLPWRGERDPYRILLSEIMLQQTRVAVVEERYRLFLQQFPTVDRLAQASEESVLAAWSGLGYYRRARSLHAAAKTIAQNNSFPGSSTALSELPGVGRYTAAAVASIAFDEPVAVVDGNVQRVIGRIIGKQLPVEKCWQTAQELLHPRRPGDFNQAMMELGAVVCLPASPTCERCPVVDFCKLRGAAPRIAQQPRKKATLTYLLAQKKDSIFLRQRARNLSLMPGMWELPETKQPKGTKRKPFLQVRHSITNTDYSVHVFQASTQIRGNPKSGRWVASPSLKEMPLTGLTRKILRALGLMS
ncbi:MAG TPA: A/G-specific adenine glycosylase [Candidatus Solibacter sp.]|jgi:A/G-specific adenine glycosylase|nr:A/G-specific adenine glycosylase [Candidatus Solibacter sp.]